MSEQTFIGKMKVIQTKFGSLTKFSLGPKDFEKLEANRKDGWANLVIKTSQKTGEPYMVLDDFVPQKQTEKKQDLYGENSRPNISEVPF